ncbi:L,D-transpeptidase family protein [Streptomyces olivochromogenes]|uniref:L,D-transpeptidase family protein n=1 Tax=Streptomyces olivochromogenes TaxID=1963 RepID=UPI001EED7E46|nr:L,D-transpeptidase family protein [Streptomyces olivochromogenes]MCF3131446.1 L,D-transpeptidase family protein [Streptomyces olivochromogenes]
MRIDGARIDGVRRVAVAVAALGTLLTAPTACGSAQHRDTEATGHRDSNAEPGGPAGSPDAGSTRPGPPGPGPQDPTRIPDVGDRLQRRIPADSGQVVAVYGDGRDSADSTVVLYAKYGANWRRVRAWPAHNGKKGWTTDHRSGDRRSPVGVFTLTDAGGVLDDPGALLPYTRDSAFAAPRWWPATHWHDFDYVIAIDYNRVAGTPPNDPTRPRGEEKGGSIWLHMDHGSGTSGCVSMSKSDMEYLLRTLDPDRRPVVVMGDRAELTA